MAININSDTIFERLIKYGLFPERLSKILSAEKLILLPNINGDMDCQDLCKSKKACQLMQYRQYKSKNIERVLEIPHPIAYINASKCIKDNWETNLQPHINRVDIEKISMITINENNKTGRLIEFENYEGTFGYEYGRLLTMDSHNINKIIEKLIINRYSLNSKYLVKTDISQCYPSMYTHSVPWALAGIDIAKKNISNKLWYNLLDEKMRKMQYNETCGFPIRSDVPAVMAEVMLATIDFKLKDFKYIRHIDDYKCFCANRDEADKFLAELTNELHKFKMKLNDKKTEILELPLPNDEKYIRNLRGLSKNLGSSIDKTNYSNWLDFIDVAVEYANASKDSNSMRYLFSTIIRMKVGDKESFYLIFTRLLGLCSHYYNLLEKLVDFIEFNVGFINNNIKKLLNIVLNNIISQCIDFQKSEPIVWSFYLAIVYDLEIEYDTQELINTKDYLPMLMGYIYDKKNNKDVSLYKLEVGKHDPAGWLFDYQVSYYESENAKCLESFRKADISFINESFEKKFFPFPSTSNKHVS